MSSLATGQYYEKYALSEKKFVIVYFVNFLGGAKQRQAQLGASQRRFTCTHHCGRCSEQSRDQTEESRRGSEEITGTCSK